MSFFNVEIVGTTKSHVDMVPDSGLVAYLARISNPGNRMNQGSGPKLLRYLIREKHWSPFEMVNIVVEVTTTRDIARQMLRHRSFSFQEYSQRYAEATQFVIREARLQDNKNRQNSIELKVGDAPELQAWFEDAQRQVIELASSVYKRALEKGIAKEQARAVLPEGCTVSTVAMNGTLRSWLHYCAIRADPSTQKEHREIAIEIFKQICFYYPDLKDFLTKELQDGTKTTQD